MESVSWKIIDFLLYLSPVTCKHVNSLTCQLVEIMIKVFVMETCPNCTEVKAQAKNDPRFELIDIGAHVRNLKEFLRLRDTLPAFDAIKRLGRVGIPCFVLEDGSVTFKADDVPLTTTETPETAEMPEGASCSLDGKGC